MSRGALRNIFTTGPLGPTLEQEMGSEVWALIGPIGDHTSHPELQDALGLLSMEFNRRHGLLSAAKHMQLAGEDGLRGGIELLRDALASAQRAQR